MAEIWSFIAADSSERASAFVRRIEEEFEPLRHYPELGPRREYLAPDLRAHLYRDHVIYYRVTETALVIVRVVHGARDVVSLFGENQNQ